MGKFHSKRYYKEQTNYYKVFSSVLLARNSQYEEKSKRLQLENEKLRRHILELLDSLHKCECEKATKQARIRMLEHDLENEKSNGKEAEAKANAYDKWFKDHDCELVFSDGYSKAEVKSCL